MAEFYGELTSGRGTTTRTGNKSTGLIAEVRSWNVGANVVLAHENGVDVVRVYRTGGTNNPTASMVAEFTEKTVQNLNTGKDMK